MRSEHPFRSTMQLRRLRSHWPIVLAIAIMWASSGGAATSSSTPAAGATPQADTDDGVALVHGEIDGIFALGGPVEPSIVLTDLSGFIDRDLTAILPPESQVIAPLRVEASRTVFSLSLPVIPQGQAHTFGNGNGPGVQVFSVNAHANLTGSAFLDSFDYSGWPTGYSTLDLAAGSFEIVGGSLLVWAPDDQHVFPIDFGPDGKLLTDDDPSGPIAAGWSLISLQQQPFVRVRDREINVTIRQGFGAVRDYGVLGMTAAFDRIIGDMRLRYPFTDAKHLDWDSLAAEFRPLIAQAEATGDFDAYNATLLDLAARIGDGHLAVSPSLPVLYQRYGGTTGLTLGETSNGDIIVTAIKPGSPADGTVLLGATLLTWDHQPIEKALSQTSILVPVSTPWTARNQQLALLPLQPAGTVVNLTYAESQGKGHARRVLLAATADPDNVLDLIGLSDADQTGAIELPVTSELLPSGIGYIRVRTFAADPALIASAWDYAIDRLTIAGADELIIDVRGNSGGIIALATYVAGSFVGRNVNLADLQIATDDGEFVTAGKLLVRPGETTWRGQFAVIVDSGCLSACEMLVAALAANSRGTIVGHEPTAGVVATVFFWILPGGYVFQAPLGRYDVYGQTWLEGEGVAPDRVIAVTRDTLLTDDDPLLEAAEAALLGPDDTPASPPIRE